MAKTKYKSITLRTPVGRLSYPYINEPQEDDEGEKAFRTGLLLKKDKWNFWESEIAKAMREVYAQISPAPLEDYQKIQVKDNDKVLDARILKKQAEGITIVPNEAERNAWLLQASKKLTDKNIGHTVPVYDRDGKKLIGENIPKISGGDYAALEINIYVYDLPKNKGVTISLEKVFYLKSAPFANHAPDEVQGITDWKDPDGEGVEYGSDDIPA